MEHKIAYDRGVLNHAPKKFNCPQCNKKRFVRFFNFETMDYLPDHFGKCDREDNCGYVQTPWEWLKTEGKVDNQFISNPKTREAKDEHHTKLVDKEVLIKTMQKYDSNNFAKYLQSVIGTATTKALLSKYYIGTAKGNATIFWQVDKFLRVRAAMKMTYLLDGHRDKTVRLPKESLFTVEDGYQPCIFGEHLIYEAPKDAVFAICESEKTAVICSAYMKFWKGRPLVWLSSCGMHGLNDDKIKPLQDLDILLVPDFSYTARAYWGSVPMRKKKNDKGVLVVHEEGSLVADYISLKDKLLRIGCGVEFFNGYEDVNDGSDLADYITSLPAPTFYEIPDFDTLALPDTKDPTDGFVDTSNLIYEKYGYGVGGKIYDEAKRKLDGQIAMQNDPRVQMLAQTMGLNFEFDY